MERKFCKCSESYVAFYIIAEDLWGADVFNCTKERDIQKGEERYICNNCKAVIDTSDLHMMAE